MTALLGLNETKGVLIAGGRDKGGSYGPLVAALAEKGRALVVDRRGPSASPTRRGAAGAVPTAHARPRWTTRWPSARRALAQRGDAVLLSPACSSYDMFKDYKDRGDRFVAAVRAKERACHPRRRTGGPRVGATGVLRRARCRSIPLLAAIVVTLIASAW